MSQARKQTHEIVDRVRRKYLGDEAEKIPIWQRLLQPLKVVLLFFVRHKWLSLILVIAAIALFFVMLVLLEDYVTKRQAFPIRNVLYQSTETTSFSGRQIGPQSHLRDRDSKSLIQKGNNDGTKLGEILGIFKMESTDEGRQYQLEDQGKTRFAYAVEKIEPVQAGLSLQGSLDLRETFSEILGREEKYIVYNIIPERGERNIQLHVITDSQGGKKLVNRLTTYRSVPLGVVWGPQFRAGTALDEFGLTAENKQKQQQIFDLIDRFQSQKALAAGKRKQIIERILVILDTMAVQNIYMSYEDGFVDYWPQESSTYLFAVPSWWQRTSMAMFEDKPKSGSSADVQIEDGIAIHNPDHDLIRIRVENRFGFFPGNYWLLNRISVGEPPNVVRPFAHANNGGYRIEDYRGVIAEIDMVDFFLHYGDDMLYKYYLDKDGNGKIDKAKELVGQVLYRVHRDVRQPISEGEGQSTTTKDVTQRYSYSFMAGTDWETRYRDFYLCNTIESFIANEINRGFGKHSDLGWINNQRSNIRLLEERSIKNLARALSAESALVAKEDIVALLRAAKRDYVNAYIQKRAGAPDVSGN